MSYENCQAQFQLASQVTSCTEISFKFDYYHPYPPGKVETQLEIDHIRSVCCWWIVCLVILSYTVCKRPNPLGQVYHKFEIDYIKTVEIK